MRCVLLALVLALAVRAQPVATLARIEVEPAAYYGRTVILIGYLWPWFRPAPTVCRGLPLARGNRAKTRSDGYFCDGTRIAFLPAGARLGFDPDRDLGTAFQMVARVVPTPDGGWLLDPLRLR